MKKLFFITMLLGALYSTECEEWNAEYGTNYNCDCNESTWQEYYNSDGHNMEGCWLYEANLEWANLTDAWLSGANFIGADLSGAYLVEANLSEANLTGANLSFAHLLAAELPGANLSGANFSYAWLSGANFTGADLSGANLSGEELEWIILDGANLCNVTASPSGDVCEESSGITDDNGDGYDDVSFDAGATSVDANNDGLVDDFPSISIIDGDAIILMQESLEQYTDSGASCSDQEDGDISHQVEVSGDIVNMSSPGTYMIFYNCSDSDGNAAQTKHRTVFIIPPIIADENEDGFDDDGFMAGAQSGDVNLDGVFNIVDIVLGVEILLNGE